ncbi:MAG: hypothetical protein CVU98_06450 [Firmicutes bacterium HGW-Firmicutes-3]|jgi:hypothetical protein|nr:MAG: hypothetical protein CVU98_06450 [Firmicutes bacterium HGW-Firmicutes-3]
MIIPNEPINEAELKVLLRKSNLSDKNLEVLKIISNEVVTNDSKTYELNIDVEMIDGLGTFAREILVFNLKVYFEEGEWILSGYEEVSSQVIKYEDMFREYTGLYYMIRDNVDSDIFVSGLAFTLDIQDVDYDGNLVGYINLESYEDID